MKSILLAALAAGFCVLDTAHAATFAPTRFDDPLPDGCTPTDCSLREAVLAANANAGPDLIRLAAGTYSLTRTDGTPDTYEPDVGALRFDESTAISGAGMTSTRVRWNVLHKYDDGIIRSNYSSTGIAIDLAGLTLSHGRGRQGGCISMPGISTAPAQLSLTGTKVERCYASLTGGAASLHHVNILMKDSIISGNRAFYDGGGLYIAGSVSIETSNVLIDGNVADRHGGGVHIWGSALVGVESYVQWVDDGTSLISNNTAVQHGGGIGARDTASLQLSTSQDATAGRLLLQNNLAAAGGAIALSGGLELADTPDNTITRVRLIGNGANSGGGVWSATSLHLADSEITDNTATSGDGGGIAMVGMPEYQPSARSLHRLGLLRNTAANGSGGGVYSECTMFEANNLSLGRNSARAGRGQQIDTVGPALLRHVTLVADYAQPPAPGLYKGYHTACRASQVQIANSLIDDRCGATVTGELASLGGNQLGALAGGCPSLSHKDQRQTLAGAFKLKLAAFGGAFDVYGWADDVFTRPQKDFASAAHCTLDDVRGLRRNDGRCDSGAFEWQ